MNVRSVGILGGGQLGRMLTEAARPLGLEVIVLDPTANCPASQVGARQIVGSFQDESDIRQLAGQVDVVTIEIEHVNANALKILENNEKMVYPSVQSIKIIQNKLLQKVWLDNEKIAVADYCVIRNGDDFRKGLSRFGGSSILKKCLGGYDGRGNVIITNSNQYEEARSQLQGDVYLERMVDITSSGIGELSVIGVCSKEGEMRFYDPAWNIHHNGILHMSVTPAPIAEYLKRNAYDLARRVIESFDTVGVFAVEMFYEGVQLYVNEVAPRVHNSGHQTIYTAATSQFENHIRAVAGLPLGDTSLVRTGILCNLLGEQGWEGEYRFNFDDLGENVHVYDYGKRVSKPGRKLGHVTLCGVTDVNEAREVLSRISMVKNEGDIISNNY